MKKLMNLISGAWKECILVAILVVLGYELFQVRRELGRLQSTLAAPRPIVRITSPDSPPAEPDLRSVNTSLRSVTGKLTSLESELRSMRSSLSSMESELRSLDRKARY